MNISASTHPEYLLNITDWERFRYTMDGGDEYIEEYLESYSARESAADFIIRKRITPLPSFAAGSITDIKNAIFQRMSEIVRVGGTKEFQDTYDGKLGGVDLTGATANYFIGNRVLPELLNIGKVGVYVDMPIIEGATLANTRAKHPYYYVYKAENIRNWRFKDEELDLLLLREVALTYDDTFELPDSEYVRYRLLTRENGRIRVRFFDSDNSQISMDGDSIPEDYFLDIDKIPFVIFELNQSLLKNIANHQIALLNLESSDIGYALMSNFPFYIEQQSKVESGYLKSPEDGEDAREITVGGSTGRTYSTEQPPDFIHPSPAPLLASIAKQDKLKDDIRTLVNLSLSAVQPKFASAEAKAHDEHGLESGLSFIGLILEHGERQLSEIFAKYENNSEPVTIRYPTRYALKSDQERINEAKSLNEMVDKIPSKKGQKAIIKLMASKLLDAKISQSDLREILVDIDNAKYMTSDSKALDTDLEKGLVSTETASKARGYEDGEVEKAKEDHAERIKRIQDSQTPRGITGLGTDPDASKEEKKVSQNSDLSTKKKVRGNANN